MTRRIVHQNLKCTYRIIVDGPITRYEYVLRVVRHAFDWFYLSLKVSIKLASDLR